MKIGRYGRDKGPLTRNNARERRFFGVRIHIQN